MKSEVSFEKLKNAVSLVAPVAGKHPTLPVLSCVLLDIQKNSIHLKATNLDMGVEVSIPAKSSAETRVAVPAVTLASFLSQARDQDKNVMVEVSSGNINISTPKSKVTIKTIPPEDFPDIPRPSEGTEVKALADMFVKGFRSVWYSASVSSVKPELSSIYIYRSGQDIVFAATDSFRLAEKRLQAPAGSSDLGDILVPFKNTSGIIRILEAIGGEISVKSNKNLISFASRTVYMVSRVIDGVFPDYKQIIPKNYSTEAVVLKKDLLDALKVSNIFSDSFNKLRLSIDPKSKSFQVETKNNDVGENKTTVDAALSGDKIDINFNYRYITDCFQSIDADSMSLQLSGSNKAMVVRPVSGDQSFTYLVMPMNR